MITNEDFNPTTKLVDYEKYIEIFAKELVSRSFNHVFKYLSKSSKKHLNKHENLDKCFDENFQNLLEPVGESLILSIESYLLWYNLDFELRFFNTHKEERYFTMFLENKVLVINYYCFLFDSGVSLEELDWMRQHEEYLVKDFIKQLKEQKQMNGVHSVYNSNKPNIFNRYKEEIISHVDLMFRQDELSLAFLLDFDNCDTFLTKLYAVLPDNLREILSKLMIHNQYFILNEICRLSNKYSSKINDIIRKNINAFLDFFKRYRVDVFDGAENYLLIKAALEKF